MLNWHTGISMVFIHVVGIAGTLLEALDDDLTDHQHELYTYFDQHIAQPFLHIYGISITLISTISFIILCYGYKTPEVHFSYDEKPSKKLMVAFHIVMGAINIYFLPISLYAFPIYISFYIYNCFLYGNIELFDAAIVAAIIITALHARKVFSFLLKACVWNPTICSVYLSYLVVIEAKRRHIVASAVDSIV